MVGNLKKYWLVWKTTSLLSIQSNLEHRFGALLFIAGKFLRFIFFLVFLFLIHRQVQEVSGYTLDQMIVFYLVFNLFDMFGQIFFRGIYWFRQQVISGEFDFKLLKPMNPLFQVLTRQTDVLDIPLLIVTLVYLTQLPILVNVNNLLPLISISLGAVLIVTAVHIAVAALGIITTEVDHTIMIFRDLSNMTRVPLAIYNDFIRGLLTFVIPVALAYTFPAQALLGLLSTSTALISLFAAVLTYLLAIRFWRYALTQYSSASS